MTLPDWPGNFAPPRFHEVSSLLRTCPLLSNAHRLLLVSQLMLLVPFHPPCFRTLSLRFQSSLSIGLAWRLTGSPVPLFSLCKGLAFSTPYTMQPSSVYNRCTFNNMWQNVAFDVKFQVFDTSSKVHLRSTHFTLTLPLTFNTSSLRIKHLSMVW